MTTNIILFCTGLYIVLGLIFFATVWKRFETDDVNFNELSHRGRIISRLLAIVFWFPMVVSILFIALYTLLQELWRMITE